MVDAKWRNSMIIAYALRDITSMAKKQPVYEKKGRAMQLIETRDNMVILKNRKGQCFPANKNNVIWCEIKTKN